MPLEIDIPARQKRVQQTVFLEANNRGLTIKVIHYDTGISQDTLRSWARGEAVMSIAGLFGLVGVIPDDLLSMLLPNGRLIVRVPEELDHDELSELAADYVKTKQDAHREDSPSGRDISACEREALDSKVVAFARAAAA